MGIIKQGILGGFSGKVAGVVGTSWKGRAVIKARPLSVANPQSEGQVAQRTSFKNVATVGSSILTAVCRAVYNPIAGNISGYNKFTSDNKQMFDGAGDFQFAQTSIGGGTLPAETLTELSTADGGETVTGVYTTAIPGGSPRLTDKCHGFVIEPISGKIWTTDGVASRSSSHCTYNAVTGPSDLVGQLQVYGYIAFVDTSGRLVSVKSSGFQDEIDFGA